jgi:hypothetical protein
MPSVRVAAALLARPRLAATLPLTPLENGSPTRVARAGQTTRVTAADSLREAARISRALTSSARLFAAPSDTRIA